MNTKNLTKQEAKNVLINGGKVYLDSKENYLEAKGLNKDIIFDQIGFNLTNWFNLYAPINGWNVLL